MKAKPKPKTSTRVKKCEPACPVTRRVGGHCMICGSPVGGKAK